MTTSAGQHHDFNDDDDLSDYEPPRLSPFQIFFGYLVLAITLCAGAFYTGALVGIAVKAYRLMVN